MYLGIVDLGMVRLVRDGEDKVVGVGREIVDMIVVGGIGMGGVGGGINVIGEGEDRVV